MNGMHYPSWTIAVRCLRRCCIGHRPGRGFQSICYSLRIRLALWITSTISLFLSLGCSFSFTFLVSPVPPRGLTRTSLAMIDFRPSSRSVGPIRRAGALGLGWRFGIDFALQAKVKPSRCADLLIEVSFQFSTPMYSSCSSAWSSTCTKRLTSLLLPPTERLPKSIPLAFDVTQPLWLRQITT